MNDLIKMGNKLKVRLANAIRITAPASRHHLIRQLNSMVKYTFKHPERCDYKVTRTAMSEPYNTRKFARYEIVTGKLVLELWVETLVVKMSYRIHDTVRCDPALESSPIREQNIQLWEGTSIAPNGAVTMAGIFTMIFIDVNCDDSRELSNYFNEVWQTPSAKKVVDIHLSTVSDDAWEKLTKQNIDNAIQARTLHIDLEGMDDAAVNEWVQGMKKTTASFTLPAGGFKHAVDFDVVEMYGRLPTDELPVGRVTDEPFHVFKPSFGTGRTLRSESTHPAELEPAFDIQVIPVDLSEAHKEVRKRRLFAIGTDGGSADDVTGQMSTADISALVGRSTYTASPGNKIASVEDIKLHDGGAFPMDAKAAIVPLITNPNGETQGLVIDHKLCGNLHCDKCNQE